MNKAGLIDSVTARIGDKRLAGEAIEGVLDAITRAVAVGEKVAISGFGVFEKQERAARTARNPATGATVKVKKTAVPKFRPGKDFKAVVSGVKKLAKAPTVAAAAAKRPTTAKSVASGASAKKAATKKKAAPAKAGKATAKKTAAKKTSAAKKSTAKKATTAKKTTAKKTTAKKTAAKRR